MKNNQVKQSESEESKLALHYMETLVEVARESFLILDHDLRVISANQVFYQNFQVSSEQTEKRLLYDLGNGQWNIPELRKLLEEILPQKKVVKDYEVSHIFEEIGRKTILLNARQIDTVQLIILAMEDITVKNDLEKKLAITAEKLAMYTKGLETRVEQTAELTARVAELESLNKSMVDRELKMIELKKENEELKQKFKK